MYLFSFWLLKASTHVHRVYVKCSQQTRTVYMDVSRIVRMLDLELCRSLPGLHALTDCDSVSAVSGRKGQGSNFEAWYKSFQTLFQSRSRHGVKPHRWEICKAPRVHLRQDVQLCDKDLSCQRATLLVWGLYIFIYWLLDWLPFWLPLHYGVCNAIQLCCAKQGKVVSNYLS